MLERCRWHRDCCRASCLNLFGHEAITWLSLFSRKVKDALSDTFVRKCCFLDIRGSLVLVQETAKTAVSRETAVFRNYSHFSEIQGLLDYHLADWPVSGQNGQKTSKTAVFGFPGLPGDPQPARSTRVPGVPRTPGTASQAGLGLARMARKAILEHSGGHTAQIGLLADLPFSAFREHFR